jgi:type IV pilus biogenesis protein CpaD/CtpE
MGKAALGRNLPCTGNISVLVQDLCAGWPDAKRRAGRALTKNYLADHPIVVKPLDKSIDILSRRNARGLVQISVRERYETPRCSIQP